jgi:hypothetical protein
VLNLGHPDVHWFVPIQRPKAGEPDKQADEAAETLAEIMEERRRKPLWGPPDGMWAHGVPSARLLLKRAVLTPMEAKKKVFIVGNAERLIAQIGTEDAPNALLKVLEEPPADTQFLLTAADPRRLLPTIRSRSIVVRLGRLSNEDVRGFLTTHAGLTARVAEERAASAEGSIGVALAEDGSAAKHRDAAMSVIDALVAGDGREFERALSQPPYQARGDFAAMLDALSQLLADAAREGTGGKSTRPVPKSLKGRSVAGLANASELVMAAREAAPGERESPASSRGARARPGGGLVRLTHTDEQGAARMVDVGGKPVTEREAVAEGVVRMSAEAFALVRDNAVAKGDVLGIARIAGIAGAKRTAGPDPALSSSRARPR